jgi:hypothetical protein
MEVLLADDTSDDRLHELSEEFRWKLRHIEGPLNEAELEEMEAEFNEIISLVRSLAVRDA